MVDRCVCCGEIIPEGTQVCINCRCLYMESEASDLHSPSQPAKVQIKKRKSQKTGWIKGIRQRNRNIC